MKTLLFLIFGFLPGVVYAQQFESGLELYNAGEYENAIRIFSSSNNPNAVLFLGKSHFNLGNFFRAAEAFESIPQNAPEDIKQEGTFALALSKFQLKNFTGALELLEQLESGGTNPDIRLRAQQFYNDLLKYLTPEERFNVYHSLKSQKIRTDLVEKSLGILDYSSAKTFVNYHLKNFPQDRSLAISRAETILADSISYVSAYPQPFLPKAPSGKIYTIGVALPQFFEDGKPNTFSRNIYRGITLAVESFNSSNTEVKAVLHYKDTQANAGLSSYVVSELIWNNGAEAIIGPLFSETAVVFADLAEQYEVPVIAPLANYDDLNRSNNYIFQLNPTFEEHGKKMAQYAVQTLGFDTLAVLVESETLGANAALAFRHEAERLGAYIAYYFDEPFSEFGYDLTEFTQVFTSDSVLVDSLGYIPVDAIYAPFTGEAAPTLTEILLTDSEGLKSKVHILGSEEWSRVDLQNRRLQDIEIYYTYTNKENQSNLEYNTFERNFQVRFGESPDLYAAIGYDAADAILKSLKTAGNPKYLKNVLRNFRNSGGLANAIIFENSHINTSVKIGKIR